MNTLASRRMLMTWLAAASFGCDRELAGNGSVKSDVRTPGPFSELEVSGAFVVKVKLKAAAHEVTIEGDDNLLPEIVTRTDGKRLTVTTARGVAPSRPIVVAVAAPDIALVRTRGAVDVTISDVDNARLQVDLDGSGKATATGRTQKLKVFVKGAGKIETAGLATREALVMIEGAGSIELADLLELEAEIHGAGAVRYGGDPKVTKIVRGAGTVEKR